MYRTHLHSFLEFDWRHAARQVEVVGSSMKGRLESSQEALHLLLFERVARIETH